MDEDINLEIEGTIIPCKKSILMENSEYFAAMFSGNFLESRQNTVRIKEVDINPMNQIIMLLWDHTYTIKQEDLLSVLQAALMLQFTKIKMICEDRILETLKPTNCLKVWKAIDQQITPLDLKAKCMALEEFSIVSETDQIFDLNLDEICIYLGHTQLRTENEFNVFQAIMKWWYESSKNNETMESTNTILKLLHCLDFKSITKENINEMKTYPDICDNQNITSLLNCILCVKEDSSDLANFSEHHQKYAIKLVNNSQTRIISESPCILLEPLSKMLEGNEEFFKRESKESHRSLIFRDIFGRKRKYDTVSPEHEVRKNSSNLDENSMRALLYDSATSTFKTFFEIPEGKCKGLTGFEILAYKEFILLFGGEVSLGNGNWNTNLWMFDSFREKWERRSVMPYYRRHFESCMVGSCMYLVGGTGQFRVVQDNLFYYNIKNDEWSPTISLPCTSRQIKCCSYNNKLFILNLADNCGYIFDEKLRQFRKISITLKKNQLYKYEIFFWEEHFYVVGNDLFKFQLIDDKLLLVQSQQHLEYSVNFRNAVLCGDTLYTFFKSTNTQEFSINTLNLNTLHSFTNEPGSFIYYIRSISAEDADVLSYNIFSVDSSVYPVSRICSFRHYESVRNDHLVNHYKLEK